MKRFLVFSGPTYYPGGGWDDLTGSFDTFEQAKNSLVLEWGDWAHIVDLETGEKTDFKYQRA
jgi:hypothetical protein